MPTPPLNIDERLKEFATARQIEFIDAVNLHGSAKAAEKALGLSKSLIARSMRGLKKVAATRGYSPEHDMKKVVPDPFIVKGVSTYYDKEGNPRGQWVKSSLNQDSLLEVMQSAMESVCEDLRGVLPPVTAPAHYDPDLLTVIPMGDPHFGLMTWSREVGEDFDLKIAEQLTFSAVDRLCSMTPSSDTAMLLNLGDMFHADNSSNRTPQSGNALDVDGRFQKIAEVGLRAMIRCVRRLLEKHAKVIVRNNRGNHDPHQAHMLTIAMNAMFHDEPRVEVEMSPSSFYYYRFGKTLIGSTHGDGAKLADLPLIMATDVPQEWAAATWRVWHCGHFHHDQLKDHPGCTVETHRTLATNDAWHKHNGYRSGRDMKAVIYHAEHGEISRVRCGISQLTAS